MTNQNVKQQPYKQKGPQINLQGGIRCNFIISCAIPLKHCSTLVFATFMKYQRYWHCCWALIFCTALKIYQNSVDFNETSITFFVQCVSKFTTISVVHLLAKHCKRHRSEVASVQLSSPQQQKPQIYSLWINDIPSLFQVFLVELPS